jgi:hypothetical protein
MRFEVSAKQIAELLHRREEMHKNAFRTAGIPEATEFQNMDKVTRESLCKFFEEDAEQPCLHPEEMDIRTIGTFFKHHAILGACLERTRSKASSFTQSREFFEAEAMLRNSMRYPDGFCPPIALGGNGQFTPAKLKALYKQVHEYCEWLFQEASRVKTQEEQVGIITATEQIKRLYSDFCNAEGNRAKTLGKEFLQAIKQLPAQERRKFTTETSDVMLSVSAL